MANIANLSIQLTAKIGSFRKRLKTARKSFTAFAKDIGRITKRVAKVTAGIAVAATAAITALTVKSANAIDDLAKNADKLGIPIEKLRALQFAAKQTGVEATTLTMAVQRMTRRVAEAGQGTGEAKDAIKELGLEAKVLAKLRPDQQFALIADRMNRVTSSGDRVRLAFKLFDSEGVAVVNTLRLGSEGLREMEEELGKLRGGLTRFDAKKIEVANDSFAKLQEVVKGIGDAVAITLAPAFVGLANRIIKAKTEGGGFTDKLSSGLDKVLDAMNIFAFGVGRFLIIPFKTAQNFADSFFALINRGFAGLFKLANKAAKALGFDPIIGETFINAFEIAAELGEDAVKERRKSIAEIKKFVKLGSFKEEVKNLVGDLESEGIQAIVEASIAPKIEDGPIKALDKVEKKAQSLDKTLRGIGSFRQVRARFAIGGVATRTSASPVFGNTGRQANPNVQAVQTNPVLVQMLEVMRGVRANTRAPISVAG